MSVRSTAFAALCIAACASALAACGNSDSDTSPAAPGSNLVLRGTVADPDSDALPLVPVNPDLVAATIDISGGNVTITVTFAPVTLSRTQTLFVADLDTDENPNTGITVDPGVLGADYVVQAVTPRNSSFATVSRASGANPCSDLLPCPVLATPGTVFPTTNQSSVTFPLTLLGNDDGRMKFKVEVKQWISEGVASPVLDVMPDLGKPPGEVR